MAYSTGYTFGFAAVVCVLCSTALATVSMGLKPQQEANARRDVQKNILAALGLPEGGAEIWGEQIDALWAEKIALKAIDPKTGAEVAAAQADQDGNGAFDASDLAVARDKVKGTKDAPAVLGVFERTDTHTLALPMVGKGLWGEISGYIALDATATTVQGTAFFAPKETPGLGYEIVKEPFKAQWVGKKVADASGATVPIRVPKPSECAEQTDPHCVDGISGATLTVRGVDAMLADALRLYDPYLKRVRGSQP
jgi:Na+-transporting NADH:ubiquinone oxidoreductase subunit C